MVNLLGIKIHGHKKKRFNLIFVSIVRKFQKYRLVFEYYGSSIFPPPLNYISYIITFVYYLKRKMSKDKAEEDTSKIERLYSVGKRKLLHIFFCLCIKRRRKANIGKKLCRRVCKSKKTKRTRKS